MGSEAMSVQNSLDSTIEAKYSDFCVFLFYKRTEEC